MYKLRWWLWLIYFILPEDEEFPKRRENVYICNFENKRRKNSFSC